MSINSLGTVVGDRHRQQDFFPKAGIDGFESNPKAGYSEYTEKLLKKIDR